MVNVKLASAGGFKAAREALRLARAKGLGAFLSSTLDGPWGIAAALQLAAAEDLQLACGLATLDLFDSPLARALPAPRNGTLKVPGGPGLGVELDEGALAGVVVDELLGLVVQLTADLPAGEGLAVDVGVGRRRPGCRARARRTPPGRCPGPAGPTTSAGRIVPLIVAGPAGHAWVPAGPLPRFEHRNALMPPFTPRWPEVDVGLLDRAREVGVAQLVADLLAAGAQLAP